MRGAINQPYRSEVRKSRGVRVFEWCAAAALGTFYVWFLLECVQGLARFHGVSP